MSINPNLDVIAFILNGKCSMRDPDADRPKMPNFLEMRGLVAKILFQKSIVFACKMALLITPTRWAGDCLVRASSPDSVRPGWPDYAPFVSRWTGL
jgi:hypothetical protein